jgi:hypothetical protein
MLQEVWDTTTATITEDSAVVITVDIMAVEDCSVEGVVAAAAEVRLLNLLCTVQA